MRIHAQSTNKIWCDCGIWSGQIRFSFYLFIRYSHFICHSVAWNGYEKLKEATTSKMNARIYCWNGAFSTKNNFYDVLQSDDVHAMASTTATATTPPPPAATSAKIHAIRISVCCFYTIISFLSAETKREFIHINGIKPKMIMIIMLIWWKRVFFLNFSRCHCRTLAVCIECGGWTQQIISFQSNFNIYQ